jgi:hypothetical protein
MTIFTLVKQYLVPVYKSEIVEAETLAVACTKAIESDSWRDAGIDYESAGATYIVFGVRGVYHNAYDAPRHLAVAIPPAFSEATAELSQT